jgi:hypothetical protein
VLVAGHLGCYEHPEGCMDVRAKNFNVDADDPCDNCCTYPSLELSVNHLYDTLNIDTTTVFEHGGKFYIIRSLNLYFSDFMLLDGASFDSASINETIEILFKANDENYERVVFPVAKVNLGRSDAYKLGTFKFADDFQKLSFDFGITKSVNHANMERIPTTNGLYQNQDSMYINQTEGFYFLKMTIESEDGLVRDLRISGDEQLIKLNFDHLFAFSDRLDKLIDLYIRYDIWFENIDFVLESTTSIEEKLINKLPEALFLN